MDHPCYKCGQLAEDGVPFCAHCGAPQIRVILPEPVLSPAESSSSLATDPGLSVIAPGQPLPSQWSQALMSCALAALIAALAISLGIIAGIGMLSAGFLAVVFYRRRRPAAIVKAAFGMVLGAISGIFAFLFVVAFEVVSMFVLRNTAEVRAKLLEFLKQLSQRTTDPQVLAMIDSLKSPGGEASLIVFFLLCLLFGFVIFSSIGGALGGTLLGRRHRR